MTQHSHNWLASELTTTMAPANPLAAILLNRVETATKIWLDPTLVLNICNLKIENYRVEEILRLNPLQHNIMWIECVLPLSHDLIFADEKLKEEAGNIFTPMAVLIERDEDASFYVTSFCKTHGVIFCPIGLQIKTTGEEAEWDILQSRYFEKENWDTDMVQSMLPIAEKTMKACAAFLVNASAILGNHYFTDYSEFHATIH